MILITIELLADGQAFKPINPHISQLSFDADFVD